MGDPKLNVFMHGPNCDWSEILVDQRRIIDNLPGSIEAFYMDAHSPVTTSIATYGESIRLMVEAGVPIPELPPLLGLNTSDLNAPFRHWPMVINMKMVHAECH